MFGWGAEEKSAFEKLKEFISDQQRLAFYDVRKPVVIQCDASTVGLGAVLMQEGQPVASVSRSLSKSEKNYVAIELECLAIVFACQRFHQYIFGKKVRIETDHKPLEIIVRKPILSAPRRLQRMLLLLQQYSLEVVFRPGEQQVLADSLSRAPAGPTVISALEEEVVFQLQMIKEHEFLPISDQRIAAIKSAAARDTEYAMLSKIIKQGWPHSTNPGSAGQWLNACCVSSIVMYHVCNNVFILCLINIKHILEYIENKKTHYSLRFRFRLSYSGL